MRRYDDPVEVRRGMVRGAAGDRGGGGSAHEGPEQFLWRGRLWQVRSVLAHWVETGPWWSGDPVRAVVGSDEAPGAPADAVGAGGAGGAAGAGVAGVAAGGAAVAVDLLGERELWRVEASRGALDTGGVFDLSFDWNDGRWQLVGCAD